MLIALFLYAASISSVLPEEQIQIQESYIVITAKKRCKELEVIIERLPLETCEKVKRMEAFTGSDGQDYSWIGCFDHFPSVEETVSSLSTGQTIEHFPPRTECSMES